MLVDFSFIFMGFFFLKKLYMCRVVVVCGEWWMVDGLVVFVDCGVVVVMWCGCLWWVLEWWVVDGFVVLGL